MKENLSEFMVCPCCQNQYSKIDAPIEYDRVATFDPLRYAAKTLGQSNKGHTKTLTPEQRQAKAQVLARNRANARYKLQVVNDATGETQDSLLKGADMLSSAEANQIIKKGGLVPGFHYVKVRV